MRLGFGHEKRVEAVIRRSFEQAMREAAWKLTSEFREVPEVRRWLVAQGVR
jgi:hypothetical protein